MWMVAADRRTHTRQVGWLGLSAIWHSFCIHQMNRVNSLDNSTVNVVIVIIILTPHRSTTYVDAAYSYRPSSVVCRSVCLSH